MFLLVYKISGCRGYRKEGLNAIFLLLHVSYILFHVTTTVSASVSNYLLPVYLFFLLFYTFSFLPTAAPFSYAFLLWITIFLLPIVLFSSSYGVTTSKIVCSESKRPVRLTKVSWLILSPAAHLSFGQNAVRSTNFPLCF